MRTTSKLIRPSHEEDSQYLVFYTASSGLELLALHMVVSGMDSAIHTLRSRSLESGI